MYNQKIIENNKRRICMKINEIGEQFDFKIPCDFKKERKLISTSLLFNNYYYDVVTDSKGISKIRISSPKSNVDLESRIFYVCREIKGSNDKILYVPKYRARKENWVLYVFSLTDEDYNKLRPLMNLPYEVSEKYNTILEPPIEEKRKSFIGLGDKNIKNIYSE